MFDRSLKRGGYTTRQMMVKALYGLGIEAALLCLWLAVPAFRPELRTSSEAVEASTSGYAYDVQACGADSSFPGMLQGIIHGLAILLLSAGSFRARNAPTAFQESNWLSLILMEVVTVGGIKGCRVALCIKRYSTGDRFDRTGDGNRSRSNSSRKLAVKIRGKRKGRKGDGG